MTTIDRVGQTDFLFANVKKLYIYKVQDRKTKKWRYFRSSVKNIEIADKLGRYPLYLGHIDVNYNILGSIGSGFMTY